MSPRGQKPPLDRTRIVDAAVAIADADGIDAVSMRTVAGRLGTGAMSLYNHVADKDELQRFMVDGVAAEIELVHDGAAPLDAIRAITVSTRAMFVAHPWASGLWLRHLPGPNRAAGMEALLARFAETDLDPDVAHLGFHAVTNHVVGYTMQELGMATGTDDLEASGRRYLAMIDDGRHPRSVEHLHQHLEGRTSSSFEVVLDVILDGLTRLDPRDL